MDKISVVINTLNEEKNLLRAIASVKGFADEIVVVDMESSDGTAEVAKKLGAQVFSHKKVGCVEPARNYAISKVADGERSRTTWILVLDPDEEISSKLASKLKEIIKNPQADYYRIPRKNIIFGKWMKHSRWWPDYNIRFFKKGFVSWNEVIHSVPMTQGKGVDLPDKEEIALIHHHYDSVSGYLERMLRYTGSQRDDLLKAGYVFSWKDIIKKPTNEFLSRYFDGEGYKDGIHGLAISLLQAFSELVLYLKVWEKQGFEDEKVHEWVLKDEINKSVKDLKWWMSKKFSFLWLKKFLKSA